MFIVKSGAISESGDPVTIEWKLWQYKDGAVFWELRNVLSTYSEGVTETWSTHRVVKTTIYHSLEQELENIGKKFWVEVRPSTNAYKAKYRDEGMSSDYIRDEWSISTVALLALLNVWHCDRKTVRDRQQCLAMLEALYAKALSLASVRTCDFLSGFRSEIETCTRVSSQVQVACRHVKYAMRKLLASEGPLWRAVVDAQKGLREADVECLAAPLIFQRWTFVLVEAVDAGVTVDASVPRMLVVPAMTTARGNKRRLDEDMRENLTKSFRCSRLASTREMVKTHVIASGASASRWERYAAISQYLANQQSWTCEGVTCVAEDASNHGKPAQNIQITIVYDSRAGYGGCALPMVAGERLKQTAAVLLATSSMQ